MDGRPSFTNLNQANTELNNIQTSISNGMNNVLSGDFSSAVDQLNKINVQYNNLVNDLKNNNIYENLQEKISRTNQMLDDFRIKVEQGLEAQKKSVTDMAEQLPKILELFRQIQEIIDKISSTFSNTTSIDKFKNEVNNIKSTFNALLEAPLLDETKVQQSANKISETYINSLKSAFSMADIGKELIIDSIKNNHGEIADQIKKILQDTSSVVSNVSNNVSGEKTISGMDAITFNKFVTDIVIQKISDNSTINDSVIDKINELLENVTGTDNNASKEYLETVKKGLTDFLELEKESVSKVDQIKASPDKKDNLVYELRELIAQMVTSAQWVSTIVSTGNIGGMEDINNMILSRLKSYDGNLTQVNEIKDLLDRLNNFDSKGFMLISDENVENMNAMNFGLAKLLSTIGYSELSANILKMFDDIDLNEKMTKKIAGIKLGITSGSISNYAASKMQPIPDPNIINSYYQVLSNFYGIGHEDYDEMMENLNKFRGSRDNSYYPVRKVAQNLNYFDESLKRDSTKKTIYEEILGLSSDDIKKYEDMILSFYDKGEDKYDKLNVLKQLFDEYQKLNEAFENTDDADKKDELMKKLANNHDKIATTLDDIAKIQSELFDILLSFDKIKDIATLTNNDELNKATGGINAAMKANYNNTDALFRLIEMLGSTESENYEKLKKSFEKQKDAAEKDYLSNTPGSVSAYLMHPSKSGGGGVLNVLKSIFLSAKNDISKINQTIERILGIKISIRSFLFGTLDYYKSLANMDIESAKAQINQGTSIKEYILKENRDMGIDYFHKFHGFISIDDYSKTSSDLIGKVQGHYGGNKNEGKDVLQGLTKSMLFLEKMYDVDTIDAVKTFYKELGKTANETENLMYRMVNTAQSSNVPVAEYIKTLESLGMTFKTIGIDVDIAEGSLDKMVRDGMSLDSARSMLQSFGNAINSFGNNWGEAGFYGVMSGQYSDPFKAGWEAVDRWDENGNVKAGAAEKVANSYATELALYRNLGTEDVGKTLMRNNLMSHGFTDKDAVTLINKIGDGDMSGFVKMFTEKSKDLGKDTIRIEGQKELESDLVVTSEYIDKFSQATNEWQYTQAKVANTNKQLVDIVADGFKNFIETFASIILLASEKIHDFTLFLADKINSIKNNPLMGVLKQIGKLVGVSDEEMETNKSEEQDSKFLDELHNDTDESADENADANISTQYTSDLANSDSSKKDYKNLQIHPTANNEYINKHFFDTFDDSTTLSQDINKFSDMSEKDFQNVFYTTTGLKEFYRNDTELDEEKNKLDNNIYNLQEKSFKNINEQQKTNNSKYSDLINETVETNKNNLEIVSGINQVTKTLESKATGGSSLGSGKSGKSGKAATSKGTLNANGISVGTKSVSSNVLQYEEIFNAAGAKYGIDPKWIEAVAMQESGGKADSKGAAWGIMQIENGGTTDDFIQYGKDEFGQNWSSNDRLDPEKSIYFGAHRLAFLLDHYNGDMAKATQAYNFSHYSLDILIKKFGDDWLSHTGEMGQYNGTGSSSYGDKDYVPHVYQYYNGDGSVPKTSSSSSTLTTTNLSSTSNMNNLNLSPISVTSGGSSLGSQMAGLMVSAPIYINGSAEYSNQTTQYNPNAFLGYDPIEGHPGWDYQGWARQWTEEYYKSTKNDKFKKDLESTYNTMSSMYNERTQFSVRINQEYSDPKMADYVTDLKKVISEVTKKYYGENTATLKIK